MQKLEENHGPRREGQTHAKQGARLLVVAALCSLCAGCAYYNNYESLDSGARSGAQSALDRVNEEQSLRLQDSQKSIKAPEPEEGEEKIRGYLGEKFPDKSINAVKLGDALQLATLFNRDFASQRDANVSSALSHIQARHIFDPRLRSTLSYFAAWSKDTNFDSESLAGTARGTLGVDLLTEYGTSLSADADTAHSHPEVGGGSATHGSSVGLSVSQPFLRGFGRMVTREPLTQAERTLTYRLRDFETFRQAFAIDTHRRFFDLVGQKQVIDNNDRRFKQADFLYEKAQAMFKINRVAQIDVFQSERQRLQAENDLRDATENYRDRLLQFKTFLGVPDSVELGIDTAALPAYKPFTLEESTAVKLALGNRLDLATAGDRVDDAKRGIKIAQNALLPSFNLDGSIRTNADSGSSFRSQSFRRHEGQAGFTVSVPLDRVNELIAAKQSTLDFEQAKRAFSQFRDELASEVRSTLRNVERIQSSVRIQKKLLLASKNRLEVAQIRFQNKESSSRDVVEAQDDLLSAENQYVQYIVDHAVATLDLKRAMGILRIDSEGRPMSDDILKPLPVEKAELGANGEELERAEVQPDAQNPDGAAPKDPPQAEK